MGGPFKLKSGNSPLFKQMASSPAKKTYKEAYAGLSAEKKATQSEEEFTKAAKDWNKDKYGTTEPTAYAKKSGMSKEGLAIHHADKMKQEKLNKEHVPDKKIVTKKVETKEVKPKSKPKTRKEIRAQKLESKKAGMSRKDIKTQKLKSKLEAADPGSRKAKRLARRYDRKTTVKAKKGEAGKKQQIASAEEKFPGGVTVRG